MSSCLYKHRSRPIAIHHQHNQLKFYFSYFCPSVSILFVFSSIRSLSYRRHNLQRCHGSHLSTVQSSLGWRRSSLSLLDDAPDYRRSRQNQSVRFLKLDHPVSVVSNKSFWILFILCENNGACLWVTQLK
jgi:hypothetical protein